MPKLRTKLAKAEHEVAYQDICDLIARHSASLTASEVLAVAANLVGKLIAMQDRNTMTEEMAGQIVMENIEHGNQTAVRDMLLRRGDVAGHG